MSASQIYNITKSNDSSLNLITISKDSSNNSSTLLESNRKNDAIKISNSTYISCENNAITVFENGLTCISHNNMHMVLSRL